ncbi:MAG: hypothetical protein MUQ33_06295, partial [Burkholderiaceae bacterium]|nr:hypothetical protein [Burkholderiaceae bacterium]
SSACHGRCHRDITSGNITSGNVTSGNISLGSIARRASKRGHSPVDTATPSPYRGGAGGTNADGRYGACSEA